MNNKKLLLQKNIGIFRYGKKEIPFCFWAHLSDNTSTIDTVIFLGSGQSGRIVKWAAGNAPTGTVIVEGLPHKLADRSARDLKEFTKQYTEVALLSVTKVFDISSVNVIAESQAAPGVIWTALDHLDKVKNVALIAPLGFTAHTLGDSPKQRLKKLKRRAFLSALQFKQSPLYDVRNFYLGFLMVYVVLHDAKWNVSGQKYAVGASHDVRLEADELANYLHKNGRSLMLILGERDKIFSPHEVMSSVEGMGIKHITTIVLETSHTSLAIRDGKHILDRAVRAVRLSSRS